MDPRSRSARGLVTVVTDEQLIKLRDWARKVADDAQFGLLLGEPGEIKTPTLLRSVEEARARCAEIARWALTR